MKKSRKCHNPEAQPSRGTETQRDTDETTLTLKQRRTATEDPSRMSRKAWKRTFGHTCAHVRSANIQISLRIRAVWSESSLGALWMIKDAKFQYADNEDWAECTDAQCDLSLLWAHMSKGTFSHVTAYLIINISYFVSGWITLMHLFAQVVRFNVQCIIMHGIICDKHSQSVAVIIQFYA